MIGILRARIFKELLSQYGVIHCIGDSHVSFFSGENKIQPRWPELSNDKTPLFKTYRVGPSLAYNLCEVGTKTRGRENLFAILESIPLGSSVMLCFGEIDCRAHILEQSELQKRNVPAIVKECVERYFTVICEVREKGYQVMVWNVIPPCLDSTPINPEFPRYGTCLERTEVTRAFNEYLSFLCREKAIIFISIFENLLDSKGKRKNNLFLDQTHLASAAIPYVLQKLYGKKENKIQSIFSKAMRYLKHIDPRSHERGVLP